MNIENMERLIGRLDSLPDKNFSMLTWQGPSGCIFHHAHEMFFGEDFPIGGEGRGVDYEIGRRLGLSNEKVIHLSCGLWADKNLSRITRADAIAELRRMVANERSKAVPA